MAAERVRRPALGIRAGLLLAFLVICGFVILASGAALQALLQVSGVLDEITGQRTPAMVASLDLSRQVERFVSAAQQLSVVETRDDYRDRSADLDIKPVLAALEKIHSDKTQALRDIVDQLSANLSRLDSVVSDRLTVAEQKAQAQHDLLNTDIEFQYATRPIERSRVSDAITLESSIGRSQAVGMAALAPSLKSLLALSRLRRVEIAFARAHDLLLIGATAASASDLQLTSLAITRALAELDSAVAEVPGDLSAALQEAAKLRPQFEAPEGVLPLHRRELEDSRVAGELVAETRAISRRLMGEVDALVEADSARVVRGAAEASAVRRASIGRLLFVIVASLGCSALIVWLYVNRRIVARLAEIRDSMLTLSRGGLSDALPPPGEDEIGRMAAALRIFRQTAIERDRTLSDVASLLDNSGEGFLSFGEDLVVDPRCSRACTLLLGTAPAGRDAAELLFAGDPGKRELLREVLTAVRKEVDPLRRDIMLSLLPNELSCQGRLLEAAYKLLDNGHLMAVLTDVTERRHLAETLTREHRHLSMVVAAVTESREFFSAVQAFRDFLGEALPRLIEDASFFQELYREIHTFKGVFSQFSFSRTPEVLHDLEEKLADLARASAPPTPPEIAAAVHSAALAAALEEDLAGLTAILGADFVSGGARVTLTVEQSARLERLAARLMRGQPAEIEADEAGDLLRDLLRLNRVPLGETLAGYGRLVEEIAVSLQKSVAPIEVQGGDDVWIDSGRFGPFLRSLAHVFRNAVAHGIEEPSRRLALGKAAQGRIVCSVVREAAAIRLSIADDGAGLDVARLRDKAVGSGLVSPEAAAGLSDAEIADLVFADLLTTREEADRIAGRGIGLAAVRAEVRKLGGEVSVQSAPGAGARFDFTVPLPEMAAFIR